MLIQISLFTYETLSSLNYVLYITVSLSIHLLDNWRMLGPTDVYKLGMEVCHDLKMSPIDIKVIRSKVRVTLNTKSLSYPQTFWSSIEFTNRSVRLYN